MECVPIHGVLGLNVEQDLLQLHRETLPVEDGGASGFSVECWVHFPKALLARCVQSRCVVSPSNVLITSLVNTGPTAAPPHQHDLTRSVHIPEDHPGSGPVFAFGGSSPNQILTGPCFE
ncbi:hypothetical protein XENOCAPTIV_025450 [Xenoophorus captivus]|uniref:Uncharacterized protein n=1 Tax=Xenoophorus captivus TaxID=1517983 RepID=A0ABV0RIV2_9TELE